MKWSVTSDKGLKKDIQQKGRKLKRPSLNKNMTKVGRLRGIKTKLILAFMVPVILIVALGIISYLKASQAIVKNYEVATQNTIEKMGEYYSLVFESVVAKSAQIVGDPSLIDYYSGTYKGNIVQDTKQFKVVEKNITSIGQTDKLIASVNVLTNYGEPVSTAGILSGDLYTPYSETEEGKIVLASAGKSIWTGYHRYLDEVAGADTEKYALALSRPFYNTALEAIGVVIVDVKTDEIQKSMKNVEFGKGSMCVLVSPDGREISTKNTTKDKMFYGQEFYNQSRKQVLKSGSMYVEYKGDTYLYIFAKIGETDAMICTLVPRDVITEQAKEIGIITLLVVLIAIFIAVMIGTILSTGIGKAIHTITGVVQSATEGDLTVVASTKRKDEFRLLSKNITNMILSMKKIIYKAASVSDTVSKSAEDVAQTSGHLVKAAKDIVEVIGNVEKGIVQQATDAENCLLKMDELAVKIKTVYESTNEIEHFANNTMAIALQGIQKMDELNDKVVETSQITKKVIGDIEILEEESKSIGGITGAINDIAAQTNLLSLNASIEAARAGEAGRGFAVVADEIRKLAEESLDASNRINLIVTGIQTRTRDTVGVAKQAEKIVASQEVALNNTVQVFRNIHEHVEGLTNNIEEISSGVKDIEYAKNDTLNAIESISAISQETAAASTEVLDLANKQLISAEELNAAANHLGQDAQELHEAIRIFKI